MSRTKKTLRSLEINDFIRDYKEFLLKEKVFSSTEDIYSFFLQGGCFIFGRILISQFPEAKLLLNKSKTHCKVRYYNKDYDIRGFVFKENDKDFKIAKKDDIKFMQENFGLNRYDETEDKLKPVGKAYEENFLYESLDSFNNNRRPRLGQIVITHHNVD